MFATLLTYEPNQPIAVLKHANPANLRLFHRNGEAITLPLPANWLLQNDGYLSGREGTCIVASD
jgi:hypothetical protein